MPHHLPVPILQAPILQNITPPLKTHGFDHFPWDLMPRIAQRLDDMTLTKVSSDGKKHHLAPAMAPCQTSGTRCLQLPGIRKESSLSGGLIQKSMK